jgi:hypothetical protein
MVFLLVMVIGTLVQHLRMHAARQSIDSCYAIEAKGLVQRASRRYPELSKGGLAVTALGR